MAQQTAMNELLLWVRKTLPMDLDYPRMIEDKIESLILKEKEQIKVSYGVGHNDGCAYMTNNKPDFEDQEQYYNETYNK